MDDFKYLLCVFEIYSTVVIQLFPLDFLGQLFENPLFSLSLPGWLSLSSLSFFLCTLYVFLSLSVLVLLRLSSVFNNLDPSHVQFFFPLKSTLSSPLDLVCWCAGVFGEPGRWRILISKPQFGITRVLQFGVLSKVL